MTALLIVAAVLLVALVVFTTVLQTLYLEALRLRTRELPALEYFRETLQNRLGMETELGALTFSLIKHTAMLFLSVVFVLVVAGRAWPVLLEACLLAWLAMLAAAYLAPQWLCRKTDARWLAPLAPVARALALTARPLTSLLYFLHTLSEMGRKDEQEQDNGRQSDPAEAFIDAGAEEGIIEEDDRRLMHSVVAFGDKTVREVMTARPSIVAISQDKPLEDLRQLVINEQFSRIPVYDGSIDNITGFVHVRDMFELDEEQRAAKTVRDLTRPIRAVPETKPVSELLREMQQDGAHMAVVVDEYGNTAGLATMEDLVEEVFGEIRDEHEPAHDLSPEPDGSYVVSGSFDVDNLKDLLDFRPPEETESTTVGGLLSEWLGRVPAAGEVVERDGIRLEVLAGNELRVERLRIARAPQVDNGAGAPG